MTGRLAGSAVLVTGGAAGMGLAHRRFGRIDVLVNNAAVFASLKPQPFDAIPEAEWDRVFLSSADSAFMTGQTLVVDGGSVFV